MKITQTRNRFWMSKTAKREQDWKYKLRTIRTKDDQEKFLRHMKRNKQAPLQRIYKPVEAHNILNLCVG